MSAAKTENGHDRHDPRQASENGNTPLRRLEKPVWRNITENFAPQWFTLAINTGVLGILYWQQPWQFRGLKIIATIMYVLQIVLFTLFAIPTTVRWTVFHEKTVAKTQGQLDEIAMLGAAPIAWLVMCALTALIVSNAPWGHAFTTVAVVMWWFGTAWMVITCIGVCIAVFHGEVAHDRTLLPSIFLPTVGVATSAVTGAVICSYAYDMNPHLAVPILIVVYFLNGMAIFISIELYTILFHRLMAVGWPEGAKLPGLMLAVGPFGQTSTALILAGTAAARDFPGYDRGTLLTMMGGQGVNTAGTMLALLLLGHDFFWIVVACAGISIGIMKRTFNYSHLWQGTIFPLGTTTLSFIALSTALDSAAFRALAAGFTVFLTINYLINLGFIFYHSVKGNLLIKPDNEKGDPKHE